MTYHRLLRFLESLPEAERLDELAKLSEDEQRELRHHWTVWARTQQVAPPGDWRIWLILAGRGFGKTRAGAEWVRLVTDADPGARIALVAASLGEARAVMVEGESGLLAVSPDGARPEFEPSLRRLTWPNGAQATLFSAGEPESLRGPQHSHAWCDELAKWDNGTGKAIAAWDNLQMGLRLGELPRVLATTTPRAVPHLKPGVTMNHDRITLALSPRIYSGAGAALNRAATRKSTIRKAPHVIPPNSGRCLQGRRAKSCPAGAHVFFAMVLCRCRRPRSF
jgi:phage terminase large subunit-like protein